MQQYVVRYKRALRRLEGIGVRRELDMVETFKLLKGSKLSADQRRSVLVGAGNLYQWEKISASMIQLYNKIHAEKSFPPKDQQHGRRGFHQRFYPKKPPPKSGMLTEGAEATEDNDENPLGAS